MSPLIDPLIRGLAIGGLAAFALAVVRSRAEPQAKWITAGMGFSVACWMISESHSMWAALGNPWFCLPMGFLASWTFWLFVLRVFEDRPLRSWMVLPAILLLLMGLSLSFLPPKESNLVGAAFNAFSGLL